MLSGFRVEAVRQTGSKELRADAVTSQCNIGRVRILRGAWNPALIDKLGSFTLGPHDDQVDALALAFNQAKTQASILARFRALAE